MRRLAPSAAALAVACLALLTAPLAAQTPSNAPSLGRSDVCQVEVLRGRARVLSRTTGEVTLSREDTLRVSGSAHLEVPPGAEVRVNWLGRASLRVWGPSALEWSLRDTRPPTGEELPLVVSGNLEWRLFDVAWMDVEVRRGEHVMRLPGDWRADLGVGALHLRGLPSGPMEVRNHAGQPLALRWFGDVAQARPPISLYAGSTLRIDRPLPARVEGGAQPEGWEEIAWPWRVEADTPTDRSERLDLGRQTRRFQGYPTQNPDQAGPVNSVRGFPDPAAVQAQVVEIPSSRSESGLGETQIPPSPVRPRPSLLSPLTGTGAPQRQRSESVPEHPSRDAPGRPVSQGEPVPGGSSFNPLHWRGHAREQLSSAGAVAVELRSEVGVRRFDSGRFQVIVDALSKEGAWCFGPDQDWWLEPGAVLVFEAGGELKFGFGQYEARAKVSGRPAYADL